MAGLKQYLSFSSLFLVSLSYLLDLKQYLSTLSWGCLMTLQVRVAKVVLTRVKMTKEGAAFSQVFMGAGYAVLFILNFVRIIYLLNQALIDKETVRSDMDVDKLIEKVLHYRGTDGKSYVEKYGKLYLMSFMEEREEIEVISRHFVSYGEKGVDIVDFVKVFLNIIPHHEEETLYLTISLIDLFRDIVESYNLPNAIRSADILNYIVDTYLNENSNYDAVPTKLIPEQNKFIQKDAVREIDINAPLVYGHMNTGIKRLQKHKIVTDNQHHNNDQIKRGAFGRDIKKFFALDSLGDHIGVYDLHCVFERKICPKTTGEKRDIIVLDFAWSDKQMRLGACMKDFTLSFWDAADMFEFEKSFMVANFVSDYQCNIWYIEFLDAWLSTDRSNAINWWDLENESKKFTMSTNKIKGQIIDIIPIEVLKLVAISSMDKQITIWNFKKQICVAQINLTNGGIHTMAFSNSYQVLITAGYENCAKVWFIHPRYMDNTLAGRLIGHPSMVTAVEIIEKTPMMITADDSGYLKTWDIRTLACLQTIDLGNRVMINKMQNLTGMNKICFIGSRLSVLDFDEETEKKVDDKLWPVKVEYNFNNNEIVILTSKDIRFLDVDTGRLKKIFTGLLTDEEEEPDLTTIRLVQQNKKFILGDLRGKMGLFQYSTGELLRLLVPHSNEVTQIKIDYINQLIISSSMDYTVCIQKERTKESYDMEEKDVQDQKKPTLNNIMQDLEDKVEGKKRVQLDNKLQAKKKGINKEVILGYELKRRIKNVHYKHEVTLLEVSVYHNIIATGSSNKNEVFLFDYEYIRILAKIELPPGSEPTNVSFINGYGILAIADSFGRITFIHFVKKNVTQIEFEKIGVYNPSGKMEKDSNSIVRMILDIEYYEPQHTIEKIILYGSTNQGTIHILDVTDLIKHRAVQLVQHANKRKNYNPDRNIEEDFIINIGNIRLNIFDVEQEFGPSIKQITESFSFRAHKDSITCLLLMAGAEKKIITAAMDGYIKIWSLKGDLYGAFNVNHPLPIEWNLYEETSIQHRKKILYSIKILENIMKRYYKHMVYSEEKMITISRFLKNLTDEGTDMKVVVEKSHVDKAKYRQKLQRLNLPSEAKSEAVSEATKSEATKSEPKTSLLNEERSDYEEEKKVTEIIDEDIVQIDNRPKKLLMKDEYDPRDLQYEKVKTIYQREIQGPTLKHMEVTKRLAEAQRQWKESTNQFQKETEKTMKRDQILEEQREKNDLMQFLLGDVRSQFYNDHQYSRKTRMLSHQLDARIHHGRKRDTNMQTNSTKRADDSVEKSEGHKTNSKKQDSPHTTVTNDFKKRQPKEKAKSTSLKPIPENTDQKQLKKKTDFFDYAQQKVKSETSTLNSTKNTSNFQIFATQVETETSDEEKNLNEAQKRKVKTKEFKHILKTMDTSLKKSQTSGMGLKTLPVLSPNRPSLMKQSVQSKDQEKPSSLLLPSVFSPQNERSSFEPNFGSDSAESVLKKSMVSIARIRTLQSTLGSPMISPKKAGLKEELDKLKLKAESEWGLDRNEEDRAKFFVENLEKSRKSFDQSTKLFLFESPKLDKTNIHMISQSSDFSLSKLLKPGDHDPRYTFNFK